MNAGLWAIAFGGNGAGAMPTHSISWPVYRTGAVRNGEFWAALRLRPRSRRSITGSGQTTAVSPGEIVSLIGQTVGPAPLVAGTIPASGTVGTTLGSTSVTFNNIPAPVIYTSGVITSVIVPYGVAGSTTASVVLKTGGQTTAAFTIPVAASVPGLFTLNDGGSGQAVAFNQDFTLNGAANAAAKGTLVVLYATGEGVTTPASQDGVVTSNFFCGNRCSRFRSLSAACRRRFSMRVRCRAAWPES